MHVTGQPRQAIDVGYHCLHSVDKATTVVYACQNRSKHPWCSLIKQQPSSLLLTDSRLALLLNS